MQSFKKYMVSNGILNETPLPDDWDQQLFNGSKSSFAKRIAYAKERASKVGAGSSRVAFIIPYQGRDTVLKIAKNQKGLVQNGEEESLLSDWYLKKLNLIIPMIDYDEENELPTWIHVEKATKINDSFFKQYAGGTLLQLVRYADKESGRKFFKYSTVDTSTIDPDNEFVQHLTDFIGNYTHIPLGDLERLANWGLYQGRPVIIDMGLTDESLKYYR